MRSLINTIMGLSLLVPAALTAQAAAGAPACHGELNGNRLTTTIEFPDGYQVQAPWNVMWNRPASLADGTEGMAVGASLDRIVEVDPATGERVVTPFPEPIETTFQAANQEQLVYRAAQIWCLTVLKAQEERAADGQAASEHVRAAAR